MDRPSTSDLRHGLTTPGRKEMVRALLAPRQSPRGWVAVSRGAGRGCSEAEPMRAFSVVLADVGVRPVEDLTLRRKSRVLQDQA
jgi:hypothetical protein